MTDTEVVNEITRYVTAELVGDPTMELESDLELLMEGIVDSMGAVRLVGFIEQSWGIRVPPQDVTIENFGTITDIANYITANLAGAGSDAEL